MNFPLNLRLAKGSGMSSPAWLISATPSATTFRIPRSAVFRGGGQPTQAGKLGTKPNVFLILIRPCDTIGVVIILRRFHTSNGVIIDT